QEILVSRSGTEPQFGVASDRVFLFEEGPEDVRILTSMELDGHRRREHFKSARAEQFSISPDGRWIAFVEGFKVFVASFPKVGRDDQKPRDLGREGGALPLGQVSENAGWFVHWSGDSKSLHWVLGPELHTRELIDVFAFLEGSKLEPPKPE